jgi:hypothetical protein
VEAQVIIDEEEPAAEESAEKKAENGVVET